MDASFHRRRRELKRARAYPTAMKCGKGFDVGDVRLPEGVDSALTHKFEGTWCNTGHLENGSAARRTLCNRVSEPRCSPENSPDFPEKDPRISNIN